MRIPFNKPYMNGKELEYIRQAHALGQLAGDGPFTKKCHARLERMTGCRKALLTHSGTAALEMAALLADLGPGDEVIMPSYTFVSTANAFVLRGAVPVFVDIRPDTLNIDETKIEAAITPRTRAIVPVHYAGVGCEMDVIVPLAKKHGLIVIEDAAHGAGSAYRARPLGTIGHLGALSFHETKTVISGEGGALLVNDERFAKRAEIIREKGTNRSAFFRGETDKYTWLDIGSSYLPGDLVAAFLFAQLESVDEILARRVKIWDRYHEAFAPLEAEGRVRRPSVPAHCRHNAHLYYLLFSDLERRSGFMRRLRDRGILSVFHYVPLHDSEAGRRYGRASGDLRHTREASDRIARLPL
ncbi:MAG: dTDP-4-amino-4,6-dideoxygalactose transaminase, partial [Candidatus Omnitrophota bacterium]